MTRRRRSPTSRRSSERDPKYDYQRAAGLLAHALGKSGQPEKALALFAETLELSTLSETQCNYAALLADQGRKAEARQWAETVLRKKLTMPSYLRRRERPWFRKAAALRQAVVKIGLGSGTLAGAGLASSTRRSTQFSVRSTAFCQPR